MNKEVEQKVKNEDKIMTVFEYFDYAVLTYKDKKVQEVHVRDAVPKFGVLLGDYTTAEEELTAIKGIIRERTISDVVMVIIYQMAMSKSGFERLHSYFKSLDEEKMILEIFKQNLYNTDGLVVRGLIPVVFENRLNHNGICS